MKRYTTMAFRRIALSHVNRECVFMKAYISRRGVLVLVGALLTLGGHAAQAQYCGNYNQVVGWAGHFSQSANGTAQSGNAKFTVNERTGGDIILKSLGVPAPATACAVPRPTLSWYTIALTGVGAFQNGAASITDDHVVSTCPPPTGGTQTLTVKLTSPRFTSLSSARLDVDFATDTYSLYVAPTAPALATSTGCPGGGPPPPTPMPDFTLYYPPPPPYLWALAIPSVSPDLSGSAPPFQAPALPSPLNIPWTVNFKLNPVWDDETDKPCHASGHSTLGCQNQSLGEDVALVGTGVSLHYQSDRAVGRASATALAAAYSRMLGGWTLNVFHAYDTTTRRLLLGDGDARSAWRLVAPLTVNGNLLVTSEDGSEVYVFDSTGRHLQTLTGLTGAVLYKFSYDAAGNLSAVTDGSGNVTKIQRDAAERPTAITSPYGQVTSLLEDANGYLSRIVDPAGQTAHFSYDPNGLMLSRTDPDGFDYSYAYDSFGRLANDSDSTRAATTVNRNDSLMLMTAAGSNFSFTVSRSTPLGRTTSYRVNLLPKNGNGGGDSTQVTWPNGLIAKASEIQRSGQIVSNLSLPDGTAVTTSAGADPRWGLQVPVPARGSVTQGSLVMSTSGSRSMTLTNPSNPFSLQTQTNTSSINGRTYRSVFSAAQRTLATTSPVGRASTITLDALERVHSLQAGGLAAAMFNYDSRGRLASIAQSDRLDSFTYDANGFLASVSNRVGLVHRFANDATGRPLSHTLPDGRVIKYSYDANSNVTSVTPPGETVHTFSYTPVNLLASYTPPSVVGGGATLYSIDADRELTRIAWPDGATTTFGYDTAGRLSSMATPTSTVVVRYDSVTGNLASASQSDGTKIAYRYDGSLPTQWSLSGAVSGAVSRAYDNNFWLISEAVSGGSTVTLTRDSDGLVTGAGAMSLVRDQTGLITATRLGVATDASTYNNVGELVGYTAYVNRAAVYDVKYQRDAAGRITDKTETIGGETRNYAYGYDQGGRLASVHLNGQLISSYLYDGNSNRVSATTTTTVVGTYDAQDRLRSYGNASFTYSAHGELATQVSGSDTTDYHYDTLGNLIAVMQPSGIRISYHVDPENHRIGKALNGVLQTGFLYDGDRIVAQLNGSGQLLSQFVYASDANSPDYMIQGSTTYRIFSDQLGSPRLVVNTGTGQIAERIDYDEFGNVTDDTNPGFQPFGFAGGLYDQDTKLVRFGARDYSPKLGRWTAKDPLLFAGGDANLYGYVANDPINLMDTSGLVGFHVNHLIPSEWQRVVSPLPSNTCSCEQRDVQVTLIDREIDYWRHVNLPNTSGPTEVDYAVAQLVLLLRQRDRFGRNLLECRLPIGSVPRELVSPEVIPSYGHGTRG